MQESLGNGVGRRLCGVGAALALGAAFGLVGVVPHADAAKVIRGNTSIEPDRAVTKQLRAKRVAVGAVKPGVKRRGAVVLPFRNGNFVVRTNNPRPYQPVRVRSITGQGVLRGGIRFVWRTNAGRRVVVLRNVRVNLRNNRVTGRLGSANLLLFRANTRRARTGGTPVRPKLRSAQLRLTPAAARRINRRLGVNALRANRSFGQLDLTLRLAR